MGDLAHEVFPSIDSSKAFCNSRQTTLSWPIFHTIHFEFAEIWPMALVQNALASNVRIQDRMNRTANKPKIMQMMKNSFPGVRNDIDRMEQSMRNKRK